MKDLVTIVIPCKNESDTLYKCVKHLSLQNGIEGVKVIIADSSTETESIHWLWKTKYDFMDVMNIKIVEGGYPSKARLFASKMATTPYVLFLDADVFLLEKDLLSSISKQNYSLITSTISTDKKWNWVFKCFNFFQWLSVKLNSPFAIGAFQYWKTEEYWRCGGYIEDELFAEDYSLSSKVDKKDFLVYKTDGIYTSPRRFENKGVWYMFGIMVASYLNRNNPNFFKHHHNYWK
jgi:glycosyltransferase involved in cell wall biosynthesis